MTDIVNRLRIKADMIELGDKIPYGSDSSVMREAADEIERLREELYEIKLAAAGGEDAPGAANMVTAKDVEKWVIKYCEEMERLREALRPFADRAAAYDPPENDDAESDWWNNNRPTIGDLRKARSALGEKE